LNKQGDQKEALKMPALSNILNRERILKVKSEVYFPVTETHTGRGLTGQLPIVQVIMEGVPACRAKPARQL